MFGNYRNNENRIPEGIKKLLNEKNIYLYGNAQYAKEMLDILNKFQIDIEGVLVSGKYWKEGEFYHKVVYKAEKFFAEFQEKIVLVAGFNILIHGELTKSLLEQDNIKAIYVLNGCQVLWQNGFQFPDSKIILMDNYYEGLIKRNLNYSYFMEHFPMFQQTYVWMADKTSKSVMDAYLKGNIELVDFPMKKLWKTDDVEKQYFPEDIIHLTDKEVFVDCGAYTGDTLESFLHKVQNFKRYYALEPDQRRFKELHSKLIDNVIHIPVGAWDRADNLNFSLEHECGEITDQEQGKLIHVDRIDNIFGCDEKITYLKMDIEGAELSALHGAEETIKRDRPVLAICVYHRRDDLITIPQYIKKIVPEYKLYLRSHFPYASEVVLYAICE